MVPVGEGRRKITIVEDAVYPMLSLQTLHTLKAADVHAVSQRATLRGRARYSISQAIVRQSEDVPEEMRVHVSVCDMLHSRKMVLYTLVMCSLW